jgi:hypothetical protein
MVDGTILKDAARRRSTFEQWISDGERRVTKQMLRIEQLRTKGKSVAEAERTLSHFRDQLEEWHSSWLNINAIRDGRVLLAEGMRRLLTIRLVNGDNLTMANSGIPDPGGPDLPTPGEPPPTEPGPGAPPAPHPTPDPLPGDPIGPDIVPGDPTSPGTIM